MDMEALREKVILENTQGVVGAVIQAAKTEQHDVAQAEVNQTVVKNSMHKSSGEIEERRRQKGHSALKVVDPSKSPFAPKSRRPGESSSPSRDRSADKK